MHAPRSRVVRVIGATIFRPDLQQDLILVLQFTAVYDAKGLPFRGCGENKGRKMVVVVKQDEERICLRRDDDDVILTCDLVDSHRV